MDLASVDELLDSKAKIKRPRDAVKLVLLSNVFNKRISVDCESSRAKVTSKK